MNSESEPQSQFSKVFKNATLENLQFRIGELARMTGVSTRQLRYWEKQGYVSAIVRDDGRESRLYGFRAYIKVSIIKQHLDNKMSLHDAVKSANDQIENVKVIQHIMKKSFQGFEKHKDRFAINLGFFDEAETQLLYVFLDNDRVRYRLVDVDDKRLKQ
ncbi:MerR family transcriptional regulator [Leuconostoc miyukkimchii]|uniref:MerR family transcriptional regulator n=1 Tax=Leuconostoc miyukkimchii TaxID=910540 RepID=UPI001C7CDCD6|nr:MerR family transcriptional regulator [Leuconostoc miyukkimchii]